MRQPEDVIPHLGKLHHWKQGRSAKALADSWFSANDIPVAVRHLLDQAPEFAGCGLVDGWLERSTDLGDGRGTASQTDLLAILGLADRIAILGIEAKVTESFGPIVSDWLADGSPGKAARLAALCSRLAISEAAAMPLRYQLLHRTVATLIEAQRYRAKDAIMAVQSFCPDATGYSDFAAFAESIGIGVVQRDCLSEARVFDGMTLRLGWVSDEISL